MKVFLMVFAAAVVAAVAGCDPETPENWKPKKVMGRDFYAPAGGDVDNWPTNMVRSEVPFASFGWGERLWINDIKWYNTPMTDEFRFKRLPYTVWDLFGPEKLPWNHNRAHFKKFTAKYPDFPYSLSVLDSWFPWFFKRHYDCDREGFAEFRKQYPGFFSFVVMNELDAGWGGGYNGTTNQVLLAQMQELLPPEYAKDAHLKFKWLDTAFDCLESMHFGSREFSCLFSINPKWAFNVAERGAKMLTCENELFIVGAPWRFGMVHTRGAARQFDIPWCWYSAHLVAGFTRDGKKKSGQWAIPSKQWPNDEPNLGASHSLLKRNNFYGYMCGALKLAWEMSEHFMNIVDTNGVRRTTVYDEEFDEMYRLDKSGFERGAVWTPLAVLTSADEAFCRNGFNQKNRDPIAQNAFFWTLQPTACGHLNWYADRAKGDQGCLLNSEFGEICDVLCPDTRQKTADFFKVLRNYPAAMLVGWFHPDRIDRAALVAYVEGGGRLYVTQKQIDDGLVPAAIAGKGRLVVIEDPIPAKFAEAMRRSYWSDEGQGAIATGRQQFPVYQQVLREVQRDFMPVTVEGDIQWGVNKREKGWFVWLINNKGVTKFHGTDEEIDHAFDAKVKITDKASGKVIETLVTAGGYKYIEIR